MQREAPRPLTRRRGQRAYSNLENFHEVFWVGLKRGMGNEEMGNGNEEMEMWK